MSMAGGIFGALLILPGLFRVSGVTYEMVMYLALVAAAAGVLLAVLNGIQYLFRRVKRKKHTMEMGIWQQ